MTTSYIYDSIPITIRDPYTGVHVDTTGTASAMEDNGRTRVEIEMPLGKLEAEDIERQVLAHSLTEQAVTMLWLEEQK